MRIGGGGRERWMAVVPLAGLVAVMTFLLGGPDQAFRAAELLVTNAAGWVSVFFRR